MQKPLWKDIVLFSKENLSEQAATHKKLSQLMISEKEDAELYYANGWAPY